MKFFACFLAVLVVLVGMSDACLRLLREGESVCTERQLCQTFMACPMGCTTQPAQNICGAVYGRMCVTRYLNQCAFNGAKCRKMEVQEVPCPEDCPEIPAGAERIAC